MIREIFECQLCEEIYFKDFKTLKDHLKCYHPREFDMLDAVYREKLNWLENQYAVKVARATADNTFLELAIVRKMAMLYVASVKYPGPINSIYSMS